MVADEIGPMIQTPFLKKISVLPDRINDGDFPFNTLGFLKPEFALEFTTPITFFVGENGSGKSTVLEAIAALCGFHESGGSNDHLNYNSTDHNASKLMQALRPSWLPKVSQGFFFRSESFFNLANYIDDTADLDNYGGTKMHRQSHGEAFLSLFTNRLGADTRVMYLMDEPETALSPSRQLTFLSLLSEWEASGNAQIIIATHSPIILAYPNASIIEFSPKGLKTVALEDTEHFKITRDFLSNRERYLKELMV